MAVGIIERVGRNTNNLLAAFGDFWIFVARTFTWLGASVFRIKTIRLLLPQMYEVGVRSVPVVVASRRSVQDDRALGAYL